MGKKLKALAGGLGENQLALTVKDSAQQIWLAGLGAFAKTQKEGVKVFDALVKEGESVQSQTLGIFAKAQKEGSKVFNALVKEGEGIQSRTRKLTDEKIAVVAGKAAGTWDRLEQVFEERVARALGSLGVPSKKDIDKLSRRVVELTAVVQGLTDKKAAPKAAAKPAIRVAVKSVAKPAVKPAPKKPVAKSVAKPVAKRPAAKPVALKAVPSVTPADVLKNIAKTNR